MAKKKIIPVYLQIAQDLANRIINDELEIGLKLSGRSMLSSYYNVSSETIRKALILLSTKGIVEVKANLGVFVVSKKLAKQFIEQYKLKNDITTLKEELIDLVKQKHDLEQQINEKILQIVDYTSRYKNSEYIVVHEYTLELKENKYTLNELQLRANTGVTVVGIKRNDEVILSPKSDEVLLDKDKLLYVGTADACLLLGHYLRSFSK